MPVAQLDRAPASEAGGRTFEPYRARQAMFAFLGALWTVGLLADRAGFAWCSFELSTFSRPARRPALHGGAGFAW